jgi:ketosteroid isomerase-like protein
MALDPVDVVRANSEAFSARDVDAMLVLYAPDAVVEDRRRMGLLGTFRGHDELRPYYLGIVNAAATLHERLDVVAADGEVVVCDCELRGRLAADPDGHEVTAPYGLVLWIREGLIRRLEIWEDGSAALAESPLQAGE